MKSELDILGSCSQADKPGGIKVSAEALRSAISHFVRVDERLQLRPKVCGQECALYAFDPGCSENQSQTDLKNKLGGKFELKKFKVQDSSFKSCCTS